MKKEDNESIELIAEVASMYYQDNMSQQQIADYLFYSRSKVSRMLTKAKELNVVEISINYPLDRVKFYESEIKNKYNVENVIVVKNKNQDEDKMLQRVCYIGGKFIDEMINDGMVIGLSWGRTVYHLIHHLKPTRKKDIEIVQITGVLSNSRYDASELIRKMATKYDAKFCPLPAPLYVGDKEVSNMLLEQPLINTTLNKAQKADLIVTGLSNFDENSSVTWENFLNLSEKAELISNGAVAIFLAHYLDKKGNIVNKGIDKKTIAISIEDIKKSKHVVIIASGEKKAVALKAVLNSNLADTLIIDDILANKLINESK